MVHFLAAGLGLFVLFGLVNRNEPQDGPNVVTVDRDALLTFIQYRIKAFNPTLAEEKRFNAFFRLGRASLIARLRERFPDLPEQPDAKTVFVKLRELRNRW